MAECANCNCQFEKKSDRKGFFRFSIENNLPGTNTIAREALSKLTASSLTPVAKKRGGQFLCPKCWAKLGDSVKYQHALDEFWSKTEHHSYVGNKRKSEEIGIDISAKKPRYSSTPAKKPSTASKSLFASSKKSTKWDAISNAVKARKYGQAIRGLYNATPGTKRHFCKFVSQIVRREINGMLKLEGSPFSQEVNVANVSDFSWSHALASVEQSAPFTYNIVKSTMTTKANADTLERGNVNLRPQLGMILACLLHAKAPRRYSFIQTLFSIQFWRGGLKRDTIKQMAHTGVCVGYQATITAVDKVRVGFDDAAICCKTNLEESLKTDHDAENATWVYDGDPELSVALAATAPSMEDEMNVDSEVEEEDDMSVEGDEILLEAEAELSDEDSLTEETAENDSEEDSLSEPAEELIPEQDEMSLIDAELLTAREVNHLVPGYTLCWDNVGKKVTSRHPTSTSANRYLNMALGYMAVNRISSTNLPWMTDESIKRASDIPLELFVPKNDDFSCLRSRMEVVVGRIICRHLPWFKTNFTECCCSHVLHDFSAESSQRSVIINLGVYDVDPSSTQGAITIYENFQKYIPSIHSKPYPSLVFGDGLSCERGNDAHRARSNGTNPWERLEGLEPAVQEFHKEMLLLQDYYDTFFSGSSVGDRGTLSNLKNVFNYRQVKSDVADNFNHAWELMCVTTEGYACLLAKHILDMSDDRPMDAPEDIENACLEEKQTYFQEVCKQVVNHVWFGLAIEKLKKSNGSFPQVICCGEISDEQTILCQAGQNCINGEVFHLTCSGIDTEDIPEEWFCSDECRNKGKPYAYCLCRTDLGEDEPMIGCSAGKTCCQVEWYHLKCVGINDKDIPEGDWFCCDTCSVAKQKGKGRRSKKKTTKANKTEKKSKDIFGDAKERYSRAILWCGLNLLCRRDAVREADGKAMMSFWALDLVHFYNRKHPKYLILAHRLVCALNGWVPDKLRYDLINNRTVNYSGGIGRNLPMDFMNEVLNRLFKDQLSAAKGRYTDATIQRCSQIIGPLGEALDKVFNTNIVENEVYRHGRRDSCRDNNVEHLIDLLEDEELFRRINGRCHKFFDNFAFSETTPDRLAGQFFTKMKQLSKKLDKVRRVAINS